VVRVKICGVTTLRDAFAAADAGADAIGLNFWPGSPRYVSLPVARRIVRALPPFVDAVGVFVGLSPREAETAAEGIGLDFVQVTGRGAGGPRGRLPVVRAACVRNRADARRIARWRADLVLADRHDPRRPGGTGRTFDWRLLRGLRFRSPLLLAGGLTPENVARAVRAVRPYGVDVSSGVEAAPGRKDPRLVRRFVRAAKEAA
jgi:phosphoribosylanthranilate isomerase